MKPVDDDQELRALKRSNSSSCSRRTRIYKNLLPLNYLRSSSLSTTTTTTTTNPPIISTTSTSAAAATICQNNNNLVPDHPDFPTSTAPNKFPMPAPTPLPLPPPAPPPPPRSSTSSTNNNKHPGKNMTATSTTTSTTSNVIRSFLHVLSRRINWPPLTKLSSSLPTTNTTTLGRKLTGTLFGHKNKGHVCFAVQDDPRSDPVLLLELATSTSTLVKEMSSGLLRIALECKTRPDNSPGPPDSKKKKKPQLFQEPTWTMYCNGKKCGYAVSRTCAESDWHLLSTVLQTVSIGAGVIPVLQDKTRRDNNVKGTSSLSELGGELMYMRARFERVVGNRDSEAFYMMNPDGTGGPELSIFLLRI